MHDWQTVGTLAQMRAGAKDVVLRRRTQDELRHQRQQFSVLIQGDERKYMQVWQPL